jgi:hypothetical protein
LLQLQRRQPPAAFVFELAAALQPAAPPAIIDEAILTLDAAGRVLLADHAAPDVHLQAIDLRVLAYVHDGAPVVAAAEAAESVWSAWLRAFLATHRCE